MGPIECKNICTDPYAGYEMSFDDMDRLDDPEVVGTFHTHPNGSSNLSFEDYESFMGYPRLTHYIIGKDGVKKFKILNGELVNAS